MDGEEEERVEGGMVNVVYITLLWCHVVSNEMILILFDVLNDVISTSLSPLVPTCIVKGVST